MRADGGTYRPSGDGQGRGHFGRRAQRMRANDGTYIGRQTSNVEFEAKFNSEKRRQIIQTVRALDAIKRLRLYGKFNHHPNLLRRAPQSGVAATNSFLGGPDTDRR